MKKAKKEIKNKELNVLENYCFKYHCKICPRKNKCDLEDKKEKKG